MASFNSGSNCFITAKEKLSAYPCNPNTVRGEPTIISYHPKEKGRVIYPNGKYIVVRNLDNPGDTFIYRGHNANTTVAKFSPNGFWVASADVSGKVKVWAWDNPEHNMKMETTVFAGSVSDLDWDSESKKIVAVGEGQGMMAKCFMWDTGNSAGEMVGHNKKIQSCAFKSSRPFKILTASMDMQTICYAGPPFKMDHSNKSVHSNFVNCIRYSNDGTKAVSVGSDKKIQFYDDKGEPTVEIKDAHGGGIYSVAFSPDGTKIITASADKTVKMWDVATLACDKTFTFSADPQIGDMQVGCTWFDTYMVSLSLNGNLNVLNADDAASPRVIQAHQSPIFSMYLDQSSGSVYTGDGDGCVMSTNLTSGVSTKLKSTDKKAINAQCHSNKVVGISKVVESGELMSVGWDDKIRFADMASGAYATTDIGLASQPVASANSRTGTLVAVITLQEVAIYKGKEKVASLSGLGYSPKSVAICNDEEVAVGDDKADAGRTYVYKIDGSTLSKINEIPTRSQVTSLAYNSTGDLLAIGDAGRQVEVYERGTWEARIKSKWVFHTSRVQTLAWSPSGNLLASGALDESIFIWNLAKPMNKLQIPFAHNGGVTGLDWVSEDRIVSVGADRVIAQWKIPSEV